MEGQGWSGLEGERMDAGESEGTATLLEWGKAETKKKPKTSFAICNKIKKLYVFYAAF